MESNFKIGDKVKFIRSNDYGVVKSIISLEKIQVEDSSKFLSIVNRSDLIKFDDQTDNLHAYGDLTSNKDSKHSSSKRKKVVANLNIVKIDLHIEYVNEDYLAMTNHEIVQSQIRKCESVLINSLDSKVQKLIIVHGVGEGVLKNEVHDLLKRYKLRFYESLNGGSTDVML